MNPIEHITEPREFWIVLEPTDEAATFKEILSRNEWYQSKEDAKANSNKDTSIGFMRMTLQTDYQMFLDRLATKT